MQLLEQGVNHSTPNSAASDAHGSHDNNEEGNDSAVTYTTLGGIFHCTIPKHFVCSTSHDLHNYFIIDSGATNHVICDSTLFTSMSNISHLLCSYLIMISCKLQ